MRLWESNSLAKTRSPALGGYGAEPRHHTKNRDHGFLCESLCPWWFRLPQTTTENTGGTGESHPTPNLNRLQFPFHDSRGSFFCED